MFIRAVWSRSRQLSQYQKSYVRSLLITKAILMLAVASVTTSCNLSANSNLHQVNSTSPKPVTTNKQNAINSQKPKPTKKDNHGIGKDFAVLKVDAATKADNLSAKKTSDWQWQLPVYFPEPNVPKDNPMTKAKVALGRHLFYDKRLSINGEFSCASCHLQELAFTDGRATSVGATGEVHPRSSLGLANVAYMPTLNWANPAVTKLEDQLLTPMFGEMPREMGLTDEHFKKVQQTFAKDEKYRALFSKAFGEDQLFDKADSFSLEHISKAIASFERSIISADSKFDRHMQGKVKLSDSEMRGKTLFFGEKAECHHCHGSFNFNDQVIHSKSRVVPIRFHNTGMYYLDELGSYIENNEGLYEITANNDDKGKFKAPSLRNVAVTAPYNHDGSTKTLEEVVANYAHGGRIIHLTEDPKSDKINGNNIGDGRFNPNKSDLIVRIDLTPDEQADIVAFLRTLTDETLLTNPKYSDPFIK